MSPAKHLTMIQEVVVVVMVGSVEQQAVLSAQLQEAAVPFTSPPSCTSQQWLTHLSDCKPAKQQ